MTVLDMHQLTGAYVLHALDTDEERAFTRHMSTCDSCAVEVAELSETVARIADILPATPPPGMRQQVLHRVRAARPSPPTRERHRAPLMRRAMLGLAAALVTAVLGAVVVVQEARLRDERAKTEAITTTLSASDAVVRAGIVQGGGRITVVTSVSKDAAVVMLADANQQPDGKVYQLWLIAGATPRPAATLAEGQTSATTYLTGVGASNLLGVTVEPEGGSTVPTLPLVAQINIS